MGSLRNPCIYNLVIFRNLADLEPEESSNACQKFKMIMHIQRPSIVRNNQSNLLQHFQGYLGIFRDIEAYVTTLIGAQLRRGRESDLVP